MQKDTINIDDGGSPTSQQPTTSNSGLTVEPDKVLFRTVFFVCLRPTKEHRSLTLPSDAQSVVIAWDILIAAMIQACV